MLQNKPLLLAIVAVLALLRFVVVPLQQQQQDLYQQLEVLSKRLQRSESLLQQQEQLQSSYTAAQQQLEKLLQPFPVVASGSQYRLTLQQQLQQLASANNASVTFFDWVSDTPLPVFNLQRGRVTLRIRGTAANVMQLHAQIEQQFPHFISRDTRSSWRGSLTPQTDVELTLLFEVDYRVQEAP